MASEQDPAKSNPGVQPPNYKVTSDPRLMRPPSEYRKSNTMSDEAVERLRSFFESLPMAQEPAYTPEQLQTMQNLAGLSKVTPNILTALRFLTRDGMTTLGEFIGVIKQQEAENDESSK